MMLRNKAVVVSTALLVAAGAALVSFNLAQAQSRNKDNVRPSTTAAPVVSPRLATGDRFAVINADGTLARGFGVVSSGKAGGAGSYEVIFNRNVTKCAYVATIGLAGSTGTASPGEITVVGRNGTKNGVFVKTLDSTGASADRPFHLIVGCKP